MDKANKQTHISHWRPVSFRTETAAAAAGTAAAATEASGNVLAPGAFFLRVTFSSSSLDLPFFIIGSPKLADEDLQSPPLFTADRRRNWRRPRLRLLVLLLVPFPRSHAYLFTASLFLPSESERPGASPSSSSSALIEHKRSLLCGDGVFLVCWSVGRATRLFRRPFVCSLSAVIEAVVQQLLRPGSHCLLCGIVPDLFWTCLEERGKNISFWILNANVLNQARDRNRTCR